MLGLVLAAAVNFFVDASSDFDVYSRNPSAAQQEFMRDHYHRMQTYSPYFDSRLNWYDRAWAYKDSMAIKPSWPIFGEHPEWVLRDAGGAMLYVDFACSGGTCPQYAADIGNPNFRAWWIAEATRLVRQVGYKGLWVDDVNLEWRISNGNGDSVTPIDPRTRQPMTLGAWRGYFATFMEELRAALPEAEIAHNSIWYATWDANVERQIRAADYINIERGVTDRGIVTGSGRYGFDTFAGFIDKVHALGPAVIMDDDDDTSITARDYELAFYHLINRGDDMLGADGDRSRMNPDNFWSGYLIDLGTPAGPRYKLLNGSYRRDFQCGYVTVTPTVSGQVVQTPCRNNSPPGAPSGLTAD